MVNYFGLSVYEPAEDSFFLAEVISKSIKKFPAFILKNLKAMDMGAGSGIQSKTFLSSGINKCNITAVDINPDSIKEIKNIPIKKIKSNLFSKVKGRFDIIAFNPPYLPQHEYDNKPDTAGGKKGDETIIRFIRQLKSHLAKKSICFLLTSSLTPNKAWQAEAKKQKLKIKKLAEKPLFCEKLYVWEIRKV